MTPSSCGAVSRADLLRVLAVAPRDQLALDINPSGWFGYVRRPEPAAAVPKIEGARPGPAPAPAPALDHRLPLLMPFAWAVAERQPRRPSEADAATRADLVPVAPIDDAAAAPASLVRLIDYEDLMPQARLLPALRRHLGSTRAGPLDLDRLAAGLAARRLPRRLPRRLFRRWHPDLVVVLDFCSRLWPYREDMHRLAERLLSHCGRSGVSLRIVNHGPHGPWTDWLAHQIPGAGGDQPPERPWTMPAAGAPVLIVGDLGLLRGTSSPEARAWAAFIDQLKRQRVLPLALAPLGAEQLDGDVAQALPVLRWSPDAPAHPAQGHGAAQPRPKGLDDLLAMVAAARRVDPPLLRAMRKLNPAAPLDAGLEGAFWCHADVEPGFAASIRFDARDRYLRRFARQLPRLQIELDALRREHHAHLSPALMHEETLVWAAHADQDVIGTRAAQKRVDDALAFMLQLLETLTRQDESVLAMGDSLAVAQGILLRADETMGERYALVLNRLAAGVHALRGEAAVPGWVDPQVLAKARPHDIPQHVWLLQDAERGGLHLQARPAGDRQAPLGAPLLVNAGGLRIQGPGGGRWLSAASLPTILAPLDAPASLRIETASEAMTVVPVRRPRGAGGWSCERDGIAVASAPLAGREMRWTASALRVVRPPGSDFWALEADAAPHPDASGTLSFGIDAAFGVYADLHVTTEHGTAIQRLQWIEPGTFLMGSPEDEPERQEREGPQHLVTLTRGLWLADTACTQALWEAVTGDNPSHFKGADRPVEQVSWNDVQGFLDKLEALVPGGQAGLPTEAEWEYACRAGTRTPFSFGATIMPERVNYGGNYPYAGGEKGMYRGETVPVKSLPPNPWGLYQMHGNVDEWCADGTRTYTPEPAVDPFGPDDKEARRAGRGGSWFVDARRARSAYRAREFPRAMRSTPWAFACA